MTVRFVIDSSILISFERNQPRDVWPTLWDHVENLLRSGEAVVPREALTELERGTDDLDDWVKKTGTVYDADDEMIAVVGQISARHPGWVQQTKNAADPFIIATAKVLGAVIVTNERARNTATVDSNMRVPQVAAEFGVTAITTNDLFRQLQWQF
ncbi:MAG: DUF4411 family protein [Micrococcales bacterium]|nr:DUF4411 family protein [Micrococcales bacterium]